MRKGPSIKSIKRIPLGFFGLIAFYFLVNTLICFSSIGRVKRINVETRHLQENTYKKVNIGQNQFTTGTEGKLSWKITNFKEAILVNLSDPDGAINYYDLLYLLMINAAIYWMVRDLKEDTIFSEELISKLKIVAYLIFFYPLIGMLCDFLAEHFVRQLTYDQFGFRFRKFSMTKAIVGLFLFQMMMPLFVKKGKSLQQENDLTI